jgi:hypothetical protein
MYLSTPIYASIYLSMYPSTYLSIHRDLPSYLSINPSTCVDLSIYQSIFLSISMCILKLHIYESTSMSLTLYLYLSMPSIGLHVESSYLFIDRFLSIYIAMYQSIDSFCRSFFTIVYVDVKLNAYSLGLFIAKSFL